MSAASGQWMGKPRLVAPVLRGVRNDQAGDGHFGASRDGGARRHRGVDLVAPVDERVWSPCSGRVGERGLCYPDTDKYTFVRIHAPWAEVRLLYVEPCVLPGQDVEAGQLIGYAQDVAARYGPLMTNHIHLEVRLVRGVLMGSAGIIPTDIICVDPLWFIEHKLWDAATQIPGAAA